MSDWLQPLELALDAVALPVSFFFRDDDAGWEDVRLLALMREFEVHQLPVDLAAIPEALGEDIAAELQMRLDATPNLVGIHQHGCRHINHESNGRKYEFGPARSAHEQHADLTAGKKRLVTLLGSRIDPIFTPPWNRCTQVTVDQLGKLGFRVLSRDRSAQALNRAALAELPIVLDWCRFYREGAGDLSVIVHGLVEQLGAPVPLGIMLHHAVMDTRQLGLTGELLQLLARHPRAHCALMRELCGLGCAEPHNEVSSI